jgi:hypothetical protein
MADASEQPTDYLLSFRPCRRRQRVKPEARLFGFGKGIPYAGGKSVHPHPFVLAE